MSPRAKSWEAVILKRIGDVYENPDLTIGNWADGEDIIHGRDCTKVTLSLSSLTEKEATIEAEFAVPASPCFAPKFHWMGEPVREDSFNNFEQVRIVNGAPAVMWGIEEFTVTVTLDRSSGRILSGEMKNMLKLNMKAGCDAAFETCAYNAPMTIEREIQIARNQQ